MSVVCSFVCSSVGLYACSSVGLYKSDWPCALPSVCLSICLSFSLIIRMSARLYVCPFCPPITCRRNRSPSNHMGVKHSRNYSVACSSRTLLHRSAKNNDYDHIEVWFEGAYYSKAELIILKSRVHDWSYKACRPSCVFKYGCFDRSCWLYMADFIIIRIAKNKD